MQNKICKNLLIGFLTIICYGSLKDAHAAFDPDRDRKIKDVHQLNRHSLVELQFMLECTRINIDKIKAELAATQTQTQADQTTLTRLQRKVQIATAKIAAMQKELDQNVASIAAGQATVTHDIEKNKGQQVHLNELLKYVDELNIFIAEKASRR